jgi:hypothetical protein
LNFYSGHEELVDVGDTDWNERFEGYWETLNIAEDEHLIGCELHQAKFYSDDFQFAGLRWLKMKVRF